MRSQGRVDGISDAGMGMGVAVGVWVGVGVMVGVGVWVGVGVAGTLVSVA